MKIAVITGASSGMGLEFAKAVDAEEELDEIWLIARRRERLEELAGSLRARARILPLDLLGLGGLRRIRGAARARASPRSRRS